MNWEEAQEFEAHWWGDCSNTMGEEFKHPTYARMMGMKFWNDGGHFFIDIPGGEGKRLLDIGGGPVSMLLRVKNAARRTVVDPCPYPDWVKARYEMAGIEYVQMPAEEFIADEKYDEAWCYNVLQHVKSPPAVINSMLANASMIRMFEWVNVPPEPGHPHTLRSEDLAVRGGFDADGWWAESQVWYDHYVGVPYIPSTAFHGYTNPR